MKKYRVSLENKCNLTDKYLTRINKGDYCTFISKKETSSRPSIYKGIVCGFVGKHHVLIKIRFNIYNDLMFYYYLCNNKNIIIVSSFKSKMNYDFDVDELPGNSIKENNLIYDT